MLPLNKDFDGFTHSAREQAGLSIFGNGFGELDVGGWAVGKVNVDGFIEGLVVVSNGIVVEVCSLGRGLKVKVKGGSGSEVGLGNGLNELDEGGSGGCVELCGIVQGSSVSGSIGSVAGLIEDGMGGISDDVGHTGGG